MNRLFAARVRGEGLVTLAMVALGAIVLIAIASFLAGQIRTDIVEPLNKIVEAVVP